MGGPIARNRAGGALRAPQKKRSEMSPMEQEIYDAGFSNPMFTTGASPGWNSDYVEQIEAIKKKYENGNAPPPPPDLGDAALSANGGLLSQERRRRLGAKNSRQASFLTGQSAEGTILTHPDVLLRGR